MKTILITLSCLLLSTFVYGNEYTAPAKVQTIFAKMFPGVENVLWEKWNDEVVAIFRDSEGMKKAFFSDQGVWRETRQKIKSHQLPLYVQTILHESYPGMEVTYAGKVYRPQEIIYRVESESTEKVIVKIFEEGGTLVSEETIRFSTPGLKVIGYLPMLPSRDNKIEPAARVLKPAQ